jgi:AraC-like DNA-binding protein
MSSMKNTTQNIGLQMVQEFASTEALSDKFLIFDNYTAPMEHLGTFAVTGHPVKLDSFLIVVCSEGYARLVIGFEEMLLSKNHFLLIQKGRLFEVMEISENFKAELMCLKQDLFEMQGSHILNLSNLLRENPCQPIPSSKQQEFEVILEYVKQTMKDTANIFRQQIVQYYLYILTCNICNLLLKNHAPASLFRSETIFQGFIKNVERHFRQERSVGFYADKLSLTPKHLSTSVHRLTGKYATDWINEYTILEAKALLKSSTLSIQQIAYELNFSTQSHFGRYFRNHTGMSPKAYRNT